jgi:hypothetical protein
MNQIRLLAAGSLLLGGMVHTAGCSSGNLLRPQELSLYDAPIELDGTASEMRTTVLSHIPQGTSLSVAQRRLKASGFECQALEEDGRTYLRCVKGSRADGPIQVERVVTVEYADDQVRDVQAHILGHLAEPESLTTADESKTADETQTADGSPSEGEEAKPAAGEGAPQQGNAG